MPAVPTPPTFVDGMSSASQMNQLGDVLRFMQKPPLGKLRQTAAQTLTTGTITAITFTTAEDVDTDVDGTGGHDTGSNTSRFTARYPGWYIASGRVSYAASNTGTRMASFAVNGVEVFGARYFIEASVCDLLVTQTLPIYLASGDYLELLGYHTHGSNLATGVANGEEQSMFSWWWISR